MKIILKLTPTPISFFQTSRARTTAPASLRIRYTPFIRPRVLQFLNNRVGNARPRRPSNVTTVVQVRITHASNSIFPAQCRYKLGADVRHNRLSSFPEGGAFSFICDVSVHPATPPSPFAAPLSDPYGGVGDEYRGQAFGKVSFVRIFPLDEVMIRVMNVYYFEMR